MRGQASLLHYSGKVGLLKITELFIECQRSGVILIYGNSDGNERLGKYVMMLKKMQSLMGLCLKSWLCDYIVTGRSIAKKET